MDREEAIEVYNGLINQKIREAFEFFAPELKESEDERIRKWIIKLIKEVEYDENWCVKSVDCNKAVAYLEKQKEQEHICDSAKFEEGFKTGLEIGLRKQKEQKLNLDTHWENGSMVCEQKEQNQKITVKIPKFRVGDIIQHVPLESWDSSRRINAIDKDGYYIDSSHLGDNVSGGFIGFYFEDEYELVEQKPAELETLGKPMTHEEWAEDYWEHHKFASPNGNDKCDVIQFEHKGFIDFCMAYCVDQKPQDRLVLHDTFGYEKGRQVGQREGVEMVLKTPESYGLYKPAEWSEEEYGRLFDIKHYLDGTLQLSPDRKIACIDFLKSLHPSWKPSEEQMDALERTTNLSNFGLESNRRQILLSLYEQLNMLM